MSDTYILDENKNPIPVSLEEWSKSFNKENRKIKQTRLWGKVLVSTVFLGLNHQYGDGPPILFETMIFGNEHDQWQDRYYTYQEALAGHEEAVKIANTVWYRRIYFYFKFKYDDYRRARSWKKWVNSHKEVEDAIVKKLTGEDDGSN